MAKQNTTAAAIQNRKLTEVISQLSPETEKLFRYGFIVLALLLFFIRPMLSLSFGPSSDEIYHKTTGDLSYDFLVSGGENDSIFRYKPTERDDAALMLNYGPAIEVIAASIYKNFGGDDYTIRHVVLALFTFLLYLYAGLTAQRIAGWRAGVIALLFMVFSPRIFGEAFNNAKDPTFAAGYMMAAYYIIGFAEQAPNPTWRRTLWLMLAIGITFAIRIGGILLYPYTLLLTGLYILRDDTHRAALFRIDFRYFAPLLARLAVVVAGSWIIGILLWPAALVSPIGQPLHALDVQSSYPTIIRLLYDGQYIQSNEVPWNYNLVYIGITTPIIILAGFFIGLVLLPVMKRYYSAQAIFFVLFISAFPLAYIIYKKSALYNGWRHSYFTYSGIAVFAALGFETVFRRFAKKGVEYALYGLLVVGLASPFYFMVKNFPLVYIYFNEWVGGIDGVYPNYQIDYYAHSARVAADWIEKNVPYSKETILLSNNNYELNTCFKAKGIPWVVDYVRWRERYERDWDYAVFLPQFVDPEMMRNGAFPPKGTVHAIKVDNSVVACVVKRENKDDFLGIQAMKQNKIAEAIPLLERAVSYNSQNEIAWTYLGLAYAQTGRLQESVQALGNALTISPESQMAAYYYNQISQAVR
jgi:tetratricopeptide (TPR) repeat protein